LDYLLIVNFNVCQDKLNVNVYPNVCEKTKNAAIAKIPNTWIELMMLSGLRFFEFVILLICTCYKRKLKK